MKNTLFNACVILLSLLLGGCSGNRPEGAGQYDGQFRPCPDKPNCVNSEATDDHQIAPFSIISSTEQTWTALQEAIEAYDEESATIILSTAEHIYAEFETPLMGYVDDVEFHLQAQKKLIQIRSASRVGHGDMGANKARIDNLRASLREKNLIQ